MWCFPEVMSREHGSNKKLVAKSCTLALVRQLYHLGVMEDTGITKNEVEIH